MTKHYCSKVELQEKILAGVNKLADNVASTLGPRGRNVILAGETGSPVITKDGVTVANFVELEDPIENVGAQIMKQAASETNSTAGDGTTTSTVLARALFREAQKYLATGASPVEMKRGMDKALICMLENLDNLSSPISSQDDIEHIATISANGDKVIGRIVATAVDSVGKDGAITVEEARSLETSLDLVEGFRFDSGYVSPQFVTDDRRGTARYDDPYILICDSQIETVDEILPILEVVARAGKPLVIVADDVEGQALAALIMNAVRGTMKIVAIKAPRYGEERKGIMRDLAISVGAKYITRESGKTLHQATLEDLGTAKTIELTKFNTTIVGGNGNLEQIEKRISTLKAEVTAMDDLYECERTQERITRLASGVAIIHVGGSTEIEMIEKKHRIEDALEAVRSAQLDGVVPGGGVALVTAAKSLDVATENDDQSLGVRIVAESVKEPIRQMSLNAGESPDLVIAEVLAAADGFGWDFSTSTVVNMTNSGIIDPTKVTKTALKNAVSVSSTLINTNYAIIDNG